MPLLVDASAQPLTTSCGLPITSLFVYIPKVEHNQETKELTFPALFYPSEQAKAEGTTPIVLKGWATQQTISGVPSDQANAAGLYTQALNHLKQKIETEYPQIVVTIPATTQPRPAKG